MFKARDYKISPFELESVLIEHPAVAEAAIVPAPDEIRLAVPKAYISLAAGYEPNEKIALSILKHARENLAPFQRVRRVEFQRQSRARSVALTCAGARRRPPPAPPRSPSCGTTSSLS